MCRMHEGDLVGLVAMATQSISALSHPAEKNKISSGLPPVFLAGAQYFHRLILLAKESFLLSAFTRRSSSLCGNNKKRI